MTRSMLCGLRLNPGICIPDWNTFCATFFAPMPVVSIQKSAKMIPPPISIVASQRTWSMICQSSGDAAARAGDA